MVCGDLVIFAGTHNYRTSIPPPRETTICWQAATGVEAFAESFNLPADWETRFDETMKEFGFRTIGERGADGLVDASAIVRYLEKKPWRKTFFVLDAGTGAEKHIAPILFCGTHSGSRYPPVVGPDGMPYQHTQYLFGGIPAGDIAGWRPGTALISTPSSQRFALDEPMVYSMGGNLVYWVHCHHWSAGAQDVSIPNERFHEVEVVKKNPAGLDNRREWNYWRHGSTIEVLKSCGKLPEDYPGYDFTGGVCADGNAPVPYGRCVYMHSCNMVLCLAGPEDSTP